MAIKPKGNKVTGTKKNDKITWLNQKAWKKSLTVNAGNGNDIIDFKKSKYKNKLYGQNGNDKIYGGTNIDTIYGGAGNDLIYGYNGNDKLYGDAGNDKLYGGNGNDILNGGKGNDQLTGGKGNDHIYTGSGNDTVSFNSGDGVDTLYKGSGSDTLRFNNFASLDKLKSGLKAKKSGNDLKLYYTKNDYILMKDFFKSGTSVKYLTDKAGHKLSFSSFMSGVKFEFTGRNDKPDTIEGSNYNDIITAGKYGGTIYGNGGDDIIYGSNISDTIYAGAGNDVIYSEGTGNTIYCGSGNDTVITGNGTNTIYLESGNNTAILGTQYTQLTGGDGNNRIIGASGNGSTFELGNGNNYIEYKNASGITITVGNGSNTIRKDGGSNSTIRVGNGNNNTVYANSTENDYVVIGNGSNNFAQIGANGSGPSSATLTAGNGSNNILIANTIYHTDVEAGNGNNNFLSANASSDGSSYATVGNGNNNHINVTGDYGRVYVGNGDNNYIDVRSNDYSINTGVDSNGNILDSTKVGSSYIYAGYNNGSTYSGGTIYSYGNDTIKTKGTPNVILFESNSSKMILTDFGTNDVTTQSNMKVNFANDCTCGLNVTMQDNLADLGLTAYFTVDVGESLGPVNMYNLILGAYDIYGNYADSQILIYNAFNPLNEVNQFKFDQNTFFYDTNGNQFGFNQLTQLVDMTEYNTTYFSSADFMNGSSFFGNHLAIVSSKNEDIIRAHGSEEIFFKEGASHDKTIVVENGGNGIITVNGMEGVCSITLGYNNTNTSNFMFSWYDSYNNWEDGNGTGYIRIYGVDESNQILTDNPVVQLNGTWEDGNFSLDDDSVYGKLSIVDYLNNTYSLSNMTQYVDMAMLNGEQFDVMNSNWFYNIYGDYFVQGTSGNDKYWWEFAGDVTINEQGGNDILKINSNKNYIGFFFEVDKYGTYSNDIIFASKNYSGAGFSYLFDGDTTNNSNANTLTINSFINSSRKTVDTIQAWWQGSGSDINKGYTSTFSLSSANIDAIVANVQSWLTSHSEYTSVMDAINRCTDSTALSQLANCFSTVSGNCWSETVVETL